MILFLKAGLAPWWGIPLGGLAAALTSLPIGLLCFRLRGPYFSLATLAVAEIFRLVALNWESLTNGPVGFLITALPPLRVAGHAVDWETKAPFYLLVALLAWAALLATAWLKRSRLGAYLVAIRENEDAAEAVGIDTVRAKVLTLALSAFLAGLGGGFYAFYFRYVDPDAVLNIALSMEMVFIAMVGGLGTVGGPLIGAIFLTAPGRDDAAAPAGRPPRRLRALHDARHPLPAGGRLGTRPPPAHPPQAEGGGAWRSWRLSG